MDVTYSDIWQAARVMVEYYGDRAQIVCLERAYTMAEEGDEPACMLWEKIATAAMELARKTPNSGELKH